MKLIKRNGSEITHIKIEGKFYTKEDAAKIQFGTVHTEKFMKSLTTKGKLDWFSRVVNESVSITQMRIIILLDSGEIKEGTIK